MSKIPNQSVYRIFLLFLAVFFGLFLSGCFEKSAPENTATILAVNDVYRIKGTYGGSKGGLPRVRALRDQLEQPGSPVLLLHAGDALYPSLMSRKFDGEQMVATLNLMDGKENSFDPYMFVAFGNHEFDKGDTKEFNSRLQESEFTWLGTNVVFEPKKIRAKSTKQHRIVTINGIKIGLFSLTINSKTQDFIKTFCGDTGSSAEVCTNEKPTESPEKRYKDFLSALKVIAKKTSASLRRGGAEFIIAITHLNIETDKQILQTLCGDGPDMIVGGHEHTAKNESVTCAGEDTPRYVLKADADAISGNIITLRRTANNEVQVANFSNQRLEENNPVPDAEMLKKVDWWVLQHENSFCKEFSGKIEYNINCLKEKIGQTNRVLTGEEIKIRKEETNLGNWIADRVLAAHANHAQCSGKPKVAFINAGSMRLNQNIMEGPITRRHLEELVEYDNELVLLHLTKGKLEKAIQRGVSNWTGNGHWLHVSGMAFRHDGTGNVSGLKIADETGNLINVDSINEKVVICATTYRFLMEPKKGSDQDGYTMLSPKDLVKNYYFPQESDCKTDTKALCLKRILEAELKKTKKPGLSLNITIDPQNKRICGPNDPANCKLADKTRGG